MPFSSPGELPDPGIELASPVSPALQADSLLTEPPRKRSYLDIKAELKCQKKINPQTNILYEHRH